MFNPFDPTAWLAKFAIDALKWLAGLNTQVFVSPPRPVNGPWTDYLYGNALGLGQYLAVVVAVVMACLAVISRRGAPGAILAFGIGIVITVLAPVYFFLCDQLAAAGDALAKAALIADKVGGQVPIAPDFGAPLSAIIGAILIFPSGVILATIIVSYELVIIVIKTLGLVVLALSSVSDSGRRRLDLLVSFAILAMLTGRPLALFITQLALVVLNNTPFGSFGFGAVIVLFAANVLAILAQLWLIRLIHKQVTKVSGRTLASVTGSVEALTRSGSRTTVESINNVNNRTLMPVGKPGSRVHDARKAVRQEVTARRNSALTARVAGSNPYVRATALVVNRYRANRAKRD